ncbi:MAG: hypothetical protein Q8P22_07105, partial [Chloroflexota bacterium]|nr:hypothetical protein [Chloroflexota bacterium]
ISEGGREGPRKLQGFKPLDGQDARRKAVAMAEELRAFLAPPPEADQPPAEKAHQPLAEAQPARKACPERSEGAWAEWERTSRRLAQRVLRRLG